MPVFVDTSILIYALDPRDSRKQGISQSWLTRLWREREGRISVQVLSEFFVNLVRLFGAGHAERAREEARRYCAWQPFSTDEACHDAAWDLSKRFSMSHRDALIVAAAGRLGCETLLTEDLADGLVLDRVRVTNPFTAVPN